ncbi:MAG: hypothetical protein O7J95_03515 [Planctomycetota bacterium]|nr:hypothetical protein [Planctomycetota bacterium]
MKNITLSADEDLIRRAREKARKQRTTLNGLFRSWLARYVGRGRTASKYEELMERLSYAGSGKSFSRDELNER